MMAAAREIAVQGEIRYDEPMSRHTSWRAGGPAEVFFVPANVEDLSLFLAELDAETPIFWHGVGSNLLVRDGGFAGVVISASKILRDLERLDHDRVTVHPLEAWPVRVFCWHSRNRGRSSRDERRGSWR
jgi:UDP-N-acetylmuramate dehydrogenase